jgi:hypothetical protein
LNADAALLAVRRFATRGKEPWRVLVPLLAVQWIAVTVFVFSVHHNGWLFYQGGDQIWYWTTSWLTGHGWIPKTLISPAWTFVLVPFALIAGPGFVSGLPAAILIQQLVLAPLALFLVYDIGSRVAGRVIGYVAATLWVLGPYVAIPLFVHRYHDKYVDQFLPHPLGLTGMGDFPSVVALLGAGACVVRVYQSRRAEWALLAGLVTGVAVLTKASNLIFLAVPALLLLSGKRWREIGLFALALLPALGALTLWKYRGYGFLPAFGSSYAPQRLALGPAGSVFTPLHKYASIDWGHLQNNLDGLGEVFFSLRILQFLPFAGAIAVARRSWPYAVAFSAWFWLYFVIKGSDSVSSVDSGSFFRLLLPAIPPLVLMTACLPVLVPRVGPALAARFPAPPPWIPSRRVLIGAAVLLALVPFAAAAALRPVQGPQRVVITNEIAVPVDSGIGLRATVASDGSVRLRWHAEGEGATRVFYRVLRQSGTDDTADCATQGGAAKCSYAGDTALATRGTTAVDRPLAGTWSYRIGVAANWIDDPSRGDIFLLSPKRVVRVP